MSLQKSTSKLVRKDTRSSYVVEKLELKLGLDEIECPDHKLPISHVCQISKCPYVFLCPECFICNEKHLIEHKSSIEPKVWIEAKFKQARGTDIMQNFSYFRVSLAGTRQRLGLSKDEIGAKIKATFDDLRVRLLAEIESMEASCYKILESEISNVRGKLETIENESKRLEENMRKYSQAKVEELKDIFNKDKEPILLRLKQLIRKMMLDESDYSGFQGEFNELSSRYELHCQKTQSNFSIDLNKISKVSLPEMNLQTNMKGGKFKEMLKTISISPSMDFQGKQAELSHLKTITLPSKPTSIYQENISMGFSLLVRYRSSSNIYGTTQTLNLYVKNVQSLLLQELHDVEARFKLTGRVYDYSNRHVFVGGRDGVVKVSERATERVLDEFVASKHRITCIHFAQIMGYIITGSENGSIAIWDLDVEQKLVFKFPNLHFSRVFGIGTSENCMVTAGGGELILSDMRKFTTTMTLSLGLSYNPSNPPMHRAIIVTPSNEEDNLVLVSSSAEKRMLIYHFKDRA